MEHDHVHGFEISGLSSPWRAVILVIVPCGHWKEQLILHRGSQLSIMGPPAVT